MWSNSAADSKLKTQIEKIEKSKKKEKDFSLEN
jgi:hypothetical protein